MRKSKFRKGLVLGIIVLFVGASVIPSISGNFKKMKDERGSVDLDNSLIGCWHFDEGSGNIAYDSSGHNNNGTIYGASWVGGISGKALWFDGYDDYVRIFDTNDFEFVNQSFTFFTWVKILNNADEWRMFICLGDIDGPPVVYLGKCRSGYQDGRIIFRVFNSAYQDATCLSVDDGDALPKNQWMHVAGVVNYESNLITLYVNGNVQESQSLVSLNLSEAQNLRLLFGNYSRPDTTYEHHHYGPMDEVHIYNRALNDTEILEYYEDYFPISTVYVDDDFNESTPGWGYDHFDSIQDGVDAVNVSGTVYVYNGTYTEGLGAQSEYIHIYKSLDLIGENKETTVVNCPYDGEFVGILIGVDFEGVNNVTVSGFTVRGAHQKGAGIVSYVGCNNITIEDCITHSFWEGIKCKTSSNVTIRNCISYNNSRDGGIAVQMGSNFVEIYGCNSYSNSYGIKIHGSDNVNCTMYHNNLINNTQNAYDECTNNWYNASIQEGNYWSDFNEPGEGAYDNNSDGIVDSPYDIPGDSNQDLYPLMHHFELYFILDIILENSEVEEGTDFKVIIKSEGGTIIPNAIVEFNDELKTTALTGTVHFTAPQVGEDTYYDIIVNRDGYTGDSETILVKDVPVEFVSTFILGRIDNLTTGGDVITFEAVNIRVITLKFPPYSTPYTSGELITISKNPFGFLGALFGVQLIFAFCGLAEQPYTSTISMNIFSQDDFTNTVIWLVSGVEGPPVVTKDVEMILLNESGEAQPDAEITFNEVNVEGYINPGDTFTVVAPSDGYYVFMLTHKISGATIYKSSLTHY